MGFLLYIAPLLGLYFNFLQVVVAVLYTVAVGPKQICSTLVATPIAVTHNVTTPALPINGGSYICSKHPSTYTNIFTCPTELPAAPSTLKLLHVAIGKGTQNYTCTSVGVVPVSDGALATLYDITSLAFLNVAMVHKVPPLCVNISHNAVPKDKAIIFPGIGTFPILGKHYFTNTSPITPTFDLFVTSQLFSGTKLLAIPAPEGAAVGPAGTGAIPWLELSDSGLSVGVAAGYRVVTAGGNLPSTCPAIGTISVQYCAEYWFYG